MGVGNAKSLGGGFARNFLALVAPVTVTGTASDKSESINFDFFFFTTIRLKRKRRRRRSRIEWFHRSLPKCFETNVSGQRRCEEGKVDVCKKQWYGT